MCAWRRKQNFQGTPPSPNPAAPPRPIRNLEKTHLGGVIFGCTDDTFKECLAEQLFGLPSKHFSFVKNIDPGLPLFLFNYSKRLLHGIFEAASPGQMNINPYGWSSGGSERTSYPAQVRIRVQKNCHPLTENKFKPIIDGNYYNEKHFWFELDHAQVGRLIALFSTQVGAPSVLRNTGNWQMVTQRPPELKTGEENLSDAYVDSTPLNQPNGPLGLMDISSCLDEINQPLGVDTEAREKDEIGLMYEKLRKLAVNYEPSDSSIASQVHESADADKMLTENDLSQRKDIAVEENIKDSSFLQSDYPSIIAQLMQELQELKAFRQEDIQKIGQLEHRLINSELEVEKLRDRCMMLESSNQSEAYTYGSITESCSEQCLDPEDIIFLLGGYDGRSWLSSLDTYSPSKDVIKSLRPMSSIRSYASVAKLNGDLYVIGGGDGYSWYDSVESYNPISDVWTSLPCLNKKKGSLAAATLHDKIFAIGGGNGVNCFSDVEMFDLDVGRWISARSMLQKRFALAAVELNGAFYAVGGFDGKDYLRTAERFDPRVHSWSRLESMNSKRGCHSLLGLNEKLYAIGGFDGSTMVSTVEVFDPRRGIWMTEAPINHSRGYAAAVVLRDSIYITGGLEDKEKLVHKVERYEEGCGWQVTNLKAIGKRCFASAIVF